MVSPKGKAESGLGYQQEQRQADGSKCSLTQSVIRDILLHARPLGHYTNRRSLNLGFGFLYYGLVRSLRPRHVVVIGSGYGFTVVCLALGLKDNARGRLSFVDPSYSVVKEGPFKTVGGTGQWDDPAKVRQHFQRFGIAEFVTHYKQRSDEFFAGYGALGLPPIDVAFIDGSHAFQDVRHDFLASLRHSHRNTYVLMHDTNIYLREFVRHAGVQRWLKLARKAEDCVEVIDFPFSSGVAIVRVLSSKSWKRIQSACSPAPQLR
jgi:predicted O-methyltransferase YrrM